jgi:hypothetical protein
LGELARPTAFLGWQILRSVSRETLLLFSSHNEILPISDHFYSSIVDNSQ